MNNYTTMASLVATMRISNKPALEDIADGVARKEVEAVWYGEVLDFSELEKAKGVEFQRQSAIMAKNGIIRVRKSTVGGAVSYALTAKSFSGADERDEVSKEVSEDMHRVFVNATGQSMDKTRYTFDAGNGLTWEVDIFTDLDGNNKPWCKIDLENPPNEYPPLPIKLGNVIPPSNRTPEQIEFVKQLNNVMFQNKVF